MITPLSDVFSGRGANFWLADRFQRKLLRIRRSAAALRAVFIAVDHLTGRPCVAALLADMRPFNGHRPVNALHDLLIRLERAFSDLGAAFAAVSVALIQRGVTVAAACEVGRDPAVVFRAAFRTLLVLEMHLCAAALTSSYRIAFCHVSFSFRMAVLDCKK